MRKLSTSLAAATLAAGFGLAQAAEREGYAQALGALYGERFWIQAHKDVCVGVLPKARPALQQAYEDWLSRHEEVVEDLRLRVAALVKGASRDQAEYTRNFSEYHEAVMRQRAADKKSLRELPREDLVSRCEALPAYLKSAESDMYNTHPKAFEVVYGRKQP